MTYGMHDYAAMFVLRFGAVIPVGSWTYTKKNGEEVDLWKTPLIKNWTKEPLRTKEEVYKEWAKYEYHRHFPNIGLVTGQICGGYIVIDMDRKPEKGVDGYDLLLRWQRETGMKLPEETWTVITGSGGYHFYYHTDTAMRPYQNPKCGVDLRADGSMIIVPPSMHRCGKRYEWEISPSDCPCAEANEAVYAFIEYCRPQDSEYKPSMLRGHGGERKMLLPPEILEGGRHDPLISLIGTLNRLGASDEAILAAVRIENKLKCKPPLTEKELQSEIFPAVFRWDKGVPAKEWQNKDSYLQSMRVEKRLSQWEKL